MTLETPNKLKEHFYNRLYSKDPIWGNKETWLTFCQNLINTLSKLISILSKFDGPNCEGVTMSKEFDFDVTLECF